MQDSKRPNPLSGWNKNQFSTAVMSTPKNDRCQILAKKGFLSLKDVTSRLALLVYSSEFQLGVLFQLPSLASNETSETLTEERTFANSAMAMILSEFQSLGVRKRDLVTYAIGGSAVDGSTETSVSMVRRTLWSHGLTLSASDLGGNQRRGIWMDVATGRTIIRSEPILKPAKPSTETHRTALQKASLTVAS